MTEDYPPELQGIIDRFAPSWPEIIDVQPGWYPLLARLDATLAGITPGYIVQQVKSKFGALSFYAQPSEEPSSFDEDFTDAIRAAEWESIETCEECGGPARQYVIQMWVSTLCTDHAPSA
ncbi:hypothetical protein [Microbacterium sp.]|uniref:hypothetical protein n=1 Tax=Microbacterium sp. TaxID=51671 RepID=UPI003F9E1B79